MRFVVGLGNPGERYRLTRHNVGFGVLDVLGARLRVGAGVQRHEARVAEARLGLADLLLVKPLSFMNLSGVPVARLLEEHDGSPGDLVVVVDDAALDLGTIRIRERGSHGGHNGLRSLVEELGTEDFPRVRVGIRSGELPEDLASWVLDEFREDEGPAVRDSLARAAEAVTCLLEEGPAAAMNRFNARPD